MAAGKLAVSWVLPLAVRLTCKELLTWVRAVAVNLGKQMPTVIKPQAADRSKASQARLAKWVGLTPALVVVWATPLHLLWVA
jgi:hypothetical protein